MTVYSHQSIFLTITEVNEDPDAVREATEMIFECNVLTSIVSPLRKPRIKNSYLTIYNHGTSQYNFQYFDARILYQGKMNWRNSGTCAMYNQTSIIQMKLAVTAHLTTMTTRQGKLYYTNCLFSILNKT